MKVLVVCEFSGIVRDAFSMLGYDAWSVDLLPTEKAGNHIQSDVKLINRDGWNIVICFPPCTYLASSGARWWKNRLYEQQEALDFVEWLLDWPTEYLALENPIGAISTRIRKPDQIIQPWQFGHGETKATCLWLKGLPLLIPTNIVSGRQSRVHYESPSSNRWKNRSRTYRGIANAMAQQWGSYVKNRRYNGI